MTKLAYPDPTQPGTPLFAVGYHLTCIHTNVAEQLDIFENNAMKVPTTTFLTIRIIGFAGGPVTRIRFLIVRALPG